MEPRPWPIFNRVWGSPNGVLHTLQLPTRSASIFFEIAWHFDSMSRCSAPSRAAVIDEVDSILIDEARIPLVLREETQTTVCWRMRQTRWSATCVPHSIAALT